MGSLTDPPDPLFRLDEEHPARPPEEEKPTDLRDEVHTQPDELRASPAMEAPLPADERPPGTTYPPPEHVERPHAARPPGAPQPTLDPSLSRAVDRAAAGSDPHDAGYDPEGYGPAPDDPSR
jgi:hypothetical protein